MATSRSQENILTNLTAVSCNTVMNLVKPQHSDNMYVRITNVTDNTINPSATLYAENGQQLGQIDLDTIIGNATLILSNQKIASLFNLTTWLGRVRLVIDAPDNSIRVMALSRNERGTLTNLSTRCQ